MGRSGDIRNLGLAKDPKYEVTVTLKVTVTYNWEI